MRTLALLLTLAALPAHAQTLDVLAAASLRAPLQRSAAAFEHAHPGVKIALDTAATGALAAQVRAGAPADVFVGASAEQVATLHDAKLLGTLEIVARNALVVAVPRDSKLAASRLDALSAAAFKRIGMGKPKVVPAGDYAMQALAAAKLDAALRPRLVFGENVEQVVTWLRSGDVDCGFVYASDLAQNPDTLRALFTVPGALHAPIVYPASVATHAKHAALASAYIAFLRQGAGASALHDAGFSPP